MMKVRMKLRSGVRKAVRKMAEGRKKKEKKVSDSRGPSRRFERTDDPWCQRSRSEGGSPDAPWDPGGGCKGERRVRNCEHCWREGWDEMSASGWRGGEASRADFWQRARDGSESQREDGNSEALCTGEKAWRADGKWKPVTDDNTGQLQPSKNDSPGPEGDNRVSVWPWRTLLRNPLRTLAALTDSERGIRICFSNITAGSEERKWDSEIRPVLNDKMSRFKQPKSTCLYRSCQRTCYGPNVKDEYRFSPFKNFVIY